jgi:hypothetical protein
MPTLVSCPDCGVPAQITERFCLPSTDGPVDHIAVHCAAGHHFRMPADRLAAPADQRPAPADQRRGRRPPPQPAQRPAPAGLPC